MYGASVRQRSLRQETTTSRAGRLLDYLYQKDVHVNKKIVLTSDAPSADPVTITEMQTPKIPAHLDSGEPKEYDSSRETAGEIAA